MTRFPARYLGQEMPEHTAVFNTILGVQADLNDLMGGVQWRNAILENDHGFAYRRAIKLEVAEAIAFTPYKWWAKVEFNRPQFRMELIDAAHFLLSFTHVVQRSAKPYYWAGQMSATQKVYTTLDAMREGWVNAEHAYGSEYNDLLAETEKETSERAVQHLERLVSNLYGRHIATQVTYSTYDLCGAWENLFSALFIVDPDFTVQNLLTEYLSKSVLNRFRTANGAKEHGLAYNKTQFLENPATYVKVWADDREDTEHLADILEGMLLAGGEIDNAKIMTALTERYAKTIEAYQRIEQ